MNFGHRDLWQRYACTSSAECAETDNDATPPSILHFAHFCFCQTVLLHTRAILDDDLIKNLIAIQHGFQGRHKPVVDCNLNATSSSADIKDRWHNGPHCCEQRKFHTIFKDMRRVCNDGVLADSFTSPGSDLKASSRRSP